MAGCITNQCAATVTAPNTSAGSTVGCSSQAVRRDPVVRRVHAVELPPEPQADRIKPGGAIPQHALRLGCRWPPGKWPSAPRRRG